MKTLILDYSTWRCGGDGINKLGEGNTALLNNQGFMCCLGQFSLQLNDEVKMITIEGLGEPHELQVEIDLLVTLDEDDIYSGLENYASDTNLTKGAIEINDEVFTTPLEKIVLLKELFAKADCEIEVINLP